MKEHKWQIVLALVLITLSAVVYLIHYFIFRDAHHIFIYMIGDIAFVFIEVLLVTIIIHRVLAIREKRLLLEKLNMVIGAFFGEVGKDLLKILSGFDPDVGRIRANLIVSDNWTAREFDDMASRLRNYSYEVDIQGKDLLPLKQKLMKEREFLLRLVENQNLLEHDSFTMLLMSVFHLVEELESRDNVNTLSPPDMKHIAGDIKRVYTLLITEWLSYMKHLRENYPYLFSFAMRTNPFDLNASPEIKE